jgi:DNA-binding CsgD family transcriptional regulator
LVDDAQWLDVPSADSLVFTARRIVGEGLVIVFGARDGELQWFAGQGLEELVLRGLDRDSAATLLDRSAPDAVASVRERLLAEAAGNPLALLELSSALSDAQIAGRSPMPQALPLTARLRSAFMQRIKRLPDPTQVALLVAAAENMGQLRVVRSAAAAMSLPDDALDPALASGIITTDNGTLTFRHPLVRSAVYESATLGRRHQAHAALAAALAGGQRADRALWHRAMATDSADEDIAGRLEASARDSQRCGGHASAASALERAAELSESETARGSRLAMAAVAAWLAGQAERARGLIDRSLPDARGTQRARLLYLSGLIEGRRGGSRHGVKALRKAAALREDVTLSLQSLREAGAMAVYAGDYEAMIAIGASSAKLSPATDMDRYIAAALGAYAADLSGEHDRGAVLSAEALEIAERLDDPMCLISASHTVARQGLAAHGLQYADRAVELAREQALVTALPFALQAQARALIGRSQFDRAYSAAEEGRRLAVDIGQPWAAALNLAYLTKIDAMRGAEALVEAHVAELDALVATSGADALTVSTSMTLGLLDLGLGWSGQPLERMLVVLSALPESNSLFVLGLPDAIEAAVRADRLSDVSDQLDRFRVWAESIPNPTGRALLARCRALVDDTDAERHFQRALEFTEALSPFDRARSELLYGEWLRRHRRRVDARFRLRAAMEAFGRLGVSPWEERARSELRASGETARKRDPSTRDQLTPQELQIARLVASGMSNPDVAAQLFLSTRTIEYHLRKVFAKLDIASRSDLSGVDLGGPVAA